jgi:hypothetical protein
MLRARPNPRLEKTPSLGMTQRIWDRIQHGDQSGWFDAGEEERICHLQRTH